MGKAVRRLKRDKRQGLLLWLKMMPGPGREEIQEIPEEMNSQGRVVNGLIFDCVP